MGEPPLWRHLVAVSRTSTSKLCKLSLQGKKVAPCRFDWHQTGSQVIISIYAKNAIPELSYVDANSTTVREAARDAGSKPRFALFLLFLLLFFFVLQLHVHVVFEGEKEFEQQISLWGVSERASERL